MKKINSFNFSVNKSFDILTVSQMSAIRGGLDATFSIAGTLSVNDPLSVASVVSVGPISATLDDKRRDRPGGGISTH